MNNKYFVPAYCITCQHGVTYLPLVEGHSIGRNFTPDGPSEVDICNGPFAFANPPDELEENWQDHLSKPNYDELTHSSIYQLFDYDFASDQLVMLELI